MKTTFTFSGLKLVIVGCILASALYYIGYSYGRSSAPQNGSVVSAQDAKRYFDKYLNTSPMSHNGVINALVVDIAQYEAMKEVLTNTTGTTGFRIYFGIDDNNKFVRVVAGIGQDGKDQAGYMVATSSQMSGICPPICDSPSGGPGQ